MQIKPTAKMEKRLSDPSRSPRQNLPNHSRKSKRRSSRKNNLVDTALDMWPNNPQNDQDVGLMSGTEYPQMLWQSASVPQNVPGNGQRLFTAMSDPSVCGYSPMPVTYTMQPVSLPGMYRIYQPMAMPNIRASHGRRRHHCNEHLANVQSVTNNTIANGYGSLQENGHLESTVNSAYQNGDYASLPPTANKDSSINSDELNAEHRRYSDPGLGPAENVHHSDSDSESIESGSSITTISCSNKLVLSLIEQMTELKKCNSLLFKELSETKTNLENVKAKLAYCKYNSPTDYQPGMLSELVREIREANKNCEESLTIKVKAIFEERYNHQAREVEELRNQISQVVKEKENSDQRIAKLEEEVTALKLSATLEKLVEILRRRVDKTTVTETVSKIRDVLTSGMCPVIEDPIRKSTNQALSSLSSSDDEEDGTENDNDNNDDNDVDEISEAYSKSNKTSSITNDSKTVIDNSLNLSGPVTDL
ncbi:AP2/ERF domain-containing protein PFD0985w isoform X4 [Pseudomyrmex gracilis]|uniref:AP2/ERF domain-containing protein PFD0985w isoform X4 n=1 Tax=Pseudomyrmex gracilis TaxID=219809 RepID=UPI000994F9E3|nr:AP2/ERF domain-containing protein PFD0985w isoform X4 [Pseudomyrmex gracilis]